MIVHSAKPRRLDEEGNERPPEPWEDDDLSLRVMDGQDEALATADLWWTHVPTLDSERLGCIGNFSASDRNSAAFLLTAAKEILRDAGCTLAVGPMNGNTWRPHRLVIEDHGDPPFFLEPRNPPDYPAYFFEAGFEILATYSSSSLPLAGKAPDLSQALARLERRGVSIRDLDPDRFEEELNAIYDVCLASFAGNFLYTPISRQEFVHSYSRVQPYLDPSFVRIAEREGVIIGFLFALPDPPAGPSGPRRVILKTLAVAPKHRSAGLGSILIAQVQERAREKGFTEAIHALQHQSNPSLRITGRYQSRLIRRYALYRCRLAT